MSEWKKESLDLKKNHNWRAPDGYRIFVGDKGAVQFNFPQDWIVKPDDDSIKFHDAEPPDDECRLAVSYLRLPPIDWSDLPLSQLVQTAVETDERPVTGQEKMREQKRAGIEIAWTELIFIDPTEKREARSRICLARGTTFYPFEATIQVLLTFEFWTEDKLRYQAAWNEVLRSLEIGNHIADPTIGNMIN